jgi:hypothetical protein
MLDMEASRTLRASAIWRAVSGEGSEVLGVDEDMFVVGESWWWFERVCGDCEILR